MTAPTLVRHRLVDVDPRRELDAGALAIARRNGFPIVASHVQRQDRFGLMTGLACATLLGGFTLWSLSTHRATPLPVETDTTPVADVVSPAALPRVTAPPGPQPLSLPDVDPMTARRSAPTLVLDVAPETRSAPVATAAASKSGEPQVVAAKPTPQQPLSADESFVERIGNGNVDTATAARLTDGANTVVQGTMIAAVLETAIDSDLPGYARAVVSEEVRSFDGTRVLIPRASHLIGQYKSGIANGQKRAYVLWSRLIRPDGSSVALASPATDFSGSTGLAGDVDTHFFARFGSTVMLSVVDVFAAIGNAATVISGGQSAASVAAQRDGQIPPTIRVPQGTPIRVFTARDLDFSAVSTDVEQR